jgi:hypothetical protein
MTPTSVKNARRLWTYEPDAALTLDPRRWARAFRDDEKCAKLRKFPVSAARKVVRMIKANNRLHASKVFGGAQ